MTISEINFDVLCDDLSLRAGACLPAEPRGVVVFLHGIPSGGPPDPGDPGYPGLSRDFAERGWVASWMDMRAARGAPGYFSIEGWVSDATGLIESLKKMEELGSLPVVLAGSSGGGAVAVEVVRRGAPVDALALLAAPAVWTDFASDAAEGITRITKHAGMQVSPDVLADPTGWREEFERVSPENSIGELRVPILILHGSDDDVVDVGHARRIAAAAPTAELEIIEGAGHQLRRVPEAIDRLLRWLDRRVTAPSLPTQQP